MTQPIHLILCTQALPTLSSSSLTPNLNLFILRRTPFPRIFRPLHLLNKIPHKHKRRADHARDQMVCIHCCCWTEYRLSSDGPRKVVSRYVFVGGGDSECLCVDRRLMRTAVIKVSLKRRCRGVDGRVSVSVIGVSCFVQLRGPLIYEVL